jgi:hypothetical protein
VGHVRRLVFAGCAASPGNQFRQRTSQGIERRAIERQQLGRRFIELIHELGLVF